MEYMQKLFRSVKQLDYLSADLNSDKTMVKMDITSISWPDNSFDRIICFHVLEHIENDKKALQELYRVLKPGGWAIIQSPVDMARDTTFEKAGVVTPEQRKEIYGQEDHVRIYGRDYPDWLRSSGFIVAGK